MCSTGRSHHHHCPIGPSHVLTQPLPLTHPVSLPTLPFPAPKRHHNHNHNRCHRHRRRWGASPPGPGPPRAHPGPGAGGGLRVCAAGAASGQRYPLPHAAAAPAARPGPGGAGGGGTGPHPSTGLPRAGGDGGGPRNTAHPHATAGGVVVRAKRKQNSGCDVCSNSMSRVEVGCCRRLTVGPLAVRHILTRLQVCGRHVGALLQACWCCGSAVPGASLPSCQVSVIGILRQEPHTSTGVVGFDRRSVVS